MITKADHNTIEQFQDELNDLISDNVEDTMSLLCVASALFASSMKCYTVALGNEGVVEFLQRTLDSISGTEKAPKSMH